MGSTDYMTIETGPGRRNIQDSKRIQANPSEL